MQQKSFLERYVKVIVVFAVIAGSASGIFGSVIKAPPMAIGFLAAKFRSAIFCFTIFQNRNQGIG